MFNNWISIPEVAHLFRRIRRDRLLREKLAGKVRLTGAARIKASWAHTEAPPTGWWDIPAVRARWNRMVSGDEKVGYQHYVALNYGSGNSRFKALSLGCGTGAKEILWAKTGLFASIDAYDLSEQRIRAANESVRATPEAEVIRFRVGDVARLDLRDRSYDIVLFDHSLHHFSNLDSLLRRINRVLVPGGLLVANEFVGPTRFQWTDRQLAEVNALLRGFPTEYTTLFHSPYPRLKAIRPSRLAMWLSDPSEAVESSNIIPLLRKHFEVMEVKGCGGAILHLLFSGIAHHFVNPDAGGQKLLESCFAAEDLLLETHDIEHDFALVICRNHDPRPTSPLGQTERVS